MTAEELVEAKKGLDSAYAYLLHSDDTRRVFDEFGKLYDLAEELWEACSDLLKGKSSDCS